MSCQQYHCIIAVVATKLDVMLAAVRELAIELESKKLKKEVANGDYVYVLYNYCMYCAHLT